MGKRDKVDIDFSSLCKEIRQESGYTQQEMADKLGTSLRSYQRWEAGQDKPSAEAAFRLAELRIAFRVKR